MTRPDGLVLVAAAGLWLVLAAARHRSSWGAPAGYLLGGLVFVVPWLAWRATYYDQSPATWPSLQPSFPASPLLFAKDLTSLAMGRFNHGVKCRR